MIAGYYRRLSLAHNLADQSRFCKDIGHHFFPYFMVSTQNRYVHSKFQSEAHKNDLGSRSRKFGLTACLNQKIWGVSGHHGLG